MLSLLLGLFSVAGAATITVGSGGDYTTISDAIAAASSGDDIVVSSGTYVESISFQGKDLTIRSESGALMTTIAPSGSTPAVTIDDGEDDAVLEGFTIAPTGGARGLLIEGTSPTIRDSVIDGAGTLGTGQGGGVYVFAGAPDFIDVNFQDNRSAMGADLYITSGSAVSLTSCTLEGGQSNYGGSLYVLNSSVTLTLVDVEESTSEYAGGFAFLDGATFVASDLNVDSARSIGGPGGAIYATGRSALTWAGGEIKDCVLDDPSYSGGGLYLTDSCALVASDLELDGNEGRIGGGMYLEDGSTGTLTTVTFTDNIASREGGALAVTATGEVTCTDCEFDGNTADRGGAVDVGSDATFVDSGGQYTSNEATDQDGGAIRLTTDAEIVITDASFAGNEAAQAGGAIYLYEPGDEIEITNTSFSVNSAGDGDGGAISADKDTDLTLTECTFDDNSTSLGDGGAVSFDPVTSGHNLTVEFSTFEGNDAGGDGGAIASEGADSASFADLLFLRNRAPSGDGGAVFLDANEDQSFLRVRFHANLADEGGGGVSEEDSTGASTIENCVFTENIGGTGGGFYRNDAAVQASLQNNTFAGNDGLSAGAHVYLENATVSFVNNIAWSGQDGGGLYAADSTSASGSDFYYNDVGNNSGGDYTGTLTDPVSSGNISEDPLFRDYTIDGDEENDDLYLMLASPCVNTGDPSVVDVDGTRSDMGAYGGPNADADDGDSDGHYDLTDCNDGDPAIHPGATEIPYDGVDQDCDGLDLTDADGDGFEGSEVGGDDCDDDDSAVYPGAAEVWYDGVDQDCNEGSDFDADADGFDWDLHGGLDCDDTDPGYRPGVADTVGDGEDQNCDGVDGVDADGDGFASTDSGGDDCDDSDPALNQADADGDGFSTCDGDCDDSSAAAYPGAAEIWYDGIDGDCAGDDDYDADADGYLGAAGGGDDCDDLDATVHPGATDTWYDGVDADCDGADDYDQDGDGYGTSDFGGLDCDDLDADINPLGVEVPYDGLDQDCDGEDETDVDNDGYEASEVGGIDCDDSDPTVHPEASDYWYDGIDSDCDGADDYDQDADGYASDAYGGDDCDDADGEVNPGRDPVDDEWYDGIDTDCDGSDDYDQDGDGVRARGHGGDDCDDTNPATYPGAVEIKDGEDNDCDGYDEMADRDEDGVADWYEWENGTQYLNPDTDGDGWSDGTEYGDDHENPRDTDGDGEIDALDQDDDGDRIPTSREQTDDINSDGLPDQDVDGDGIPNGLDTDSDGDGMSDKQEGAVDRDADGVPDYLDYQGDFIGGGCTGCSTGSGNGGGLWWMLAGFAVVLRRRAAGVVAAAAMTTTAAAQSFESPPIDARGFWVADTAGSPQRSVRLVYPGLGDGWDVGLLMDLAHNPVREMRTDGKSKVVVDTMATSHLYGAYDWNGLRFDASYPFTAYGHEQVGGFVASGDMRLGALYPFLDSSGGWPALGVQALAWAPTGANARWSGSPGFAGGLVLTAAQHFERFGYTLNLGARVGQQDTVRNLTSGSGPIGGLDLNYLLPVLDDGIGVGVDAVIQGTSGFVSFPVEPGVHVRGRLASGTFAVIGAAMGIGDAVGGSQWRAYLGVGHGGLPAVPEVVQTESTVVVPVIVERIERASEDGPLAELVDDRIIVREQVFFREAVAEIIPASTPVLKAVLQVLQNHPEIEHLLVAGHTNSNRTTP